MGRAGLFWDYLAALRRTPQIFQRSGLRKRTLEDELSEVGWKKGRHASCLGCPAWLTLRACATQCALARPWPGPLWPAGRGPGPAPHRDRLHVPHTPTHAVDISQALLRGNLPRVFGLFGLIMLGLGITIGGGVWQLSGIVYSGLAG